MANRTRNWGMAAGLLALGVAVAARRRRRVLDFAGKSVLIAGGSRGLGLVLARHALSLGAKVSICGREKASLDRALAELRGMGEAIGSVCDLTHEADVARWIESAHSAFGSLDVLVYNAGIIQVGPVESMQLPDYRKAMQTHVFGALHVLEKVIPKMKAQGGGSIALIASMGGKRSIPHMLPYDVSKFALVGLGEGLSIELEKDGIYVTTVCPATMRTGSPDNATFKGDHRAEFTWFSLLDALPGLSTGAEDAAGKIFAAIANRKPLLIFPWTAKVGLTIGSLFPDTYVRVMRRVNRLLPQEASPEAHLGKESHTELSPSVLTTLGDAAAVKNNETLARPKP